MTTKLPNRRITTEQQRLLALLRRNARESTASLARKLGIARTTVAERILRLERDGIINGYTVRVTDAFARQRITALVLINVNPKLSDLVEIDRILDALGRIEGIERTQTSIVLSVKFER